MSRQDQSIQSLFIESTKAMGPGFPAVGDSQTQNHYHTWSGMKVTPRTQDGAELVRCGRVLKKLQESTR